MPTNYTPPSPGSVTLTLRPFTSRQPDDLLLYVDDFGPGVITGRITDSDGNPVQGAYVKAVDQDLLSAKRVQTDQYGEYRIGVPDGGTFHVAAWATADGGGVLSAVTLPSLPVTRSSEAPSTAQSRSLVAWYRFEDGDARDYTATLDAPFADTTAYDATENGATYTSTDGVTDFQNGASSGAYGFGGSSSLNIGTMSGAQFTGADSFTVTAWGYPRSQGSGYPMIISPEDGSTTNNIWSILQSDNSGSWQGYMRFRLYASSGQTDLAAMDAPLNQYTHFAFGYDSDDGVAFEYSNGVERDRKVVDFSPVSYPGDWTIGAGNSGVNLGWDGFIDDVRIYNRALTSSEISDIYNATQP